MPSTFFEGFCRRALRYGGHDGGQVSKLALRRCAWVARSTDFSGLETALVCFFVVRFLRRILGQGCAFVGPMLRVVCAFKDR